MPVFDGNQAIPRPSLLVFASPQRWAETLRPAEPFWDLEWVASSEDFSRALQQQRFPVALVESPAEAAEVQLPDGAQRFTQVICLSETLPDYRGFGSDEALAVLHPGTPPVDFLQWLDTARAVARLSEERHRLQRRLSLRRSPLVGSSPAMERLRQQIASAALHDWPILIAGEPGSGRDLVATAIHEASERSHRPLIRINCRVHTAASLERELFGEIAHRPDQAPVVGRFDYADGGVIVLDGIDHLSFPLQNVLARVLDRKAFQRLGDSRESPLTARVVAITTRDLEEMQAAGEFREELLRHFAGPVLQPPPLRDIRGDIAPLTEHLLQRISQRLGEPPRRLMLETLQKLQAHDWPGNVRELEVLLERACTMQRGSKLTPDMVEAWLAGTPVLNEPLGSVSLAQMERHLIEATFARCAGNRELTAQSLQIGLRTLSGKLREYGYPPRGGPGSNQVSREREAA